MNDRMISMSNFFINPAALLMFHTPNYLRSMFTSKVTLSQKERELVTNADLILTKNGIMQKVATLFGQLSDRYRLLLQQHPLLVADEAFVPAPKIARGEQYEGLPWMMLDYPRYFTSTDVFAIRSFFWWGHYCSITLQLSGRYQQQYAVVLEHALRQQSDKDPWFIGVGGSPWQHHFRSDNYQQVTKNTLLTQLPFSKLAKKIPLTEWDDVEIFFDKEFALLLHMLQADQAPNL